MMVTAVALTGAIVSLAFGDRFARRTAPAVRLVYDVHGIGGGRLGDARTIDMARALQRRMERQGMREVRVSPVGPKIEVLAPASVPKEDLERVLAMGGMLSFHVVVEDANEPGVSEMLARMKPGGAGPQARPGDRLRWLPFAQAGAAPLESSADGDNHILVYATPDRSMTHYDIARPWSVKHAQVTSDESGGAAVAFELDRAGAKRFGELTGNNIGRMLAITLDGKVLSAPRIHTRIEAHGMINGPPGGFTQEQATYLASVLNVGLLPAQLSGEPVAEEYLTMTLGLSPSARAVLKWSAVALAVLAALLWFARLALRRLHPTVYDQEAALRSLGLYDQA